MTDVQTFTGSLGCIMRSGSSQVREVAVGQPLTVGFAGAIGCDTGDVVGNQVTFSQPGRATVSHMGGVFSVLAFEPAALARVPRQQSSGASGADRSDDARQLCLRQLATHSDWNGTAEDMQRFNLTHFGA